MALVPQPYTVRHAGSGEAGAVQRKQFGEPFARFNCGLKCEARCRVGCNHCIAHLVADV